MAAVSESAGERPTSQQNAAVASHDSDLPPDVIEAEHASPEAPEVAGSPFVEGAPVIPARRHRRSDAPLHWFLLILSVVVIGIAIVLTVPGEGRTNEVAIFGSTIPELCTSKRWFNRECPGCGMTRCFISLAHLDFARAWQFNPAGIYLFVILALQIPYRIVQLARIYTGRMPLQLTLLVWFMWLLPVFLMAQWIFRTFF